MKNNFLLPHRCKIIGWGLLLPSLVLGILLLFNSELLTLNVPAQTFLIGSEFFSDSFNITPTLIGILILSGALLVGFSKEKQEDEFITQIRLNALIWAVLVNYLLLLLAFLLIYNLDFINVMLYNIFTVLLIFILRFHYLFYIKFKAQKND